MIRVSCLRFLLVVSPPPAWMCVGFSASVVLGVFTLWLNPRDVDSALGSVLMLQMFSASGGFAAPASRGYFDSILVTGRSRGRIAMGSLAASTLPGIAAWMVVLMSAAIVGRADVAVSLHRQVALVLVSTIAWAGGLALPRMAAGGLWTFVLVAAALSRGAVGEYLAVVQVSPVDVSHTLRSAAAFAVCPYLLLGDFAAAKHMGVIGVDLLAASIVTWAGYLYIARRDYSLVEPA